MAVTTEKKALGVHWDLDDVSSFNSPSVTSDASTSSTSTFQFLNSQLVAHGFTSSPGLSFDGLSTKDMEKAVKCLLGMLSQRVGDMGQTEDLTTKLRTLSYDYERLLSMHRTNMEKAESMEKEANLYKSRMEGLARTLQAMTNSLKSTQHDLQRTRVSLQALRQTHASEIKRKEKEMERTVEKWSRLAEAQSKLTAAPNGLTIKCGNAAPVEGAAGMEIGGGEGYLDVALRDADEARRSLAEDNARLRALVLAAVNDLQSTLSLTKGLYDLSSSVAGVNEVKYDQSTLFPLEHPGFALARETITSLRSSLNDAVTLLSQRIPRVNPPPQAGVETRVQSEETPKETTEHAHLKEIIDKLRGELEQAHDTNAREAQELFDQFATDQHRFQAQFGDADTSMDLMTAPAKDAERERIDSLRKELDAERAKFTEATIILGKERAKLEAERLKFLEEKRQAQLDMMLADLPATPAHPALKTSLPGRTETKLNPPRKSLTSSPMKKSAGRKTRASRRSSIGLASNSQSRVQPSYETEVIPSAPPVDQPSFGGLLPTTFVLPPPSPLSTLPTQPVLVSLSSGTTPEEASQSPSAAPPEPDPFNSGVPQSSPPSSPSQRPFPVAKPLATRMIHAYSPVKPSPLSRILMLADSPTGGVGLGRPEDHKDLFPAVQTPSPERSSLAAELGVSSGSEDGDGLFVAKIASDGPNPTSGSTTHRTPSAVRVKTGVRRLTNQQKGKWKADAPQRSGGGVATEREDDTKRTSSKSFPAKSALKAVERSRANMKALNVKGSLNRKVPIEGSSSGWRR